MNEQIGRPDAHAIGKLVNDELFFARKSFGMFGQIHVVVVAVDRESIWVRIATRHDLRDEAVVTNVRNAMLNYLQDTLPCRAFRATHSNPRRGVTEREFLLDFEYPGPGSEPLPSALWLTEPADPQREAFREQMAGVDYPEPSERCPPAVTDDYLRARTWAYATVRAFGSLSARHAWRVDFLSRTTWRPGRPWDTGGASTARETVP